MQWQNKQEERLAKHYRIVTAVMLRDFVREDAKVLQRGQIADRYGISGCLVKKILDGGYHGEE